ncbi:hypothetical protein, partial [Escherichia coli]|uniref:hypothetical protein n=1 Tax=Escherichia coli TaxID=562 RepID=UPI001BB0FAAD
VEKAAAILSTAAAFLYITSLCALSGHCFTGADHFSHHNVSAQMCRHASRTRPQDEGTGSPSVTTGDNRYDDDSSSAVTDWSSPLLIYSCIMLSA